MRKLYTDDLSKFLSDAEYYQRKATHLEYVFENSNSPTLNPRSLKIRDCGTYMHFSQDEQSGGYTLDAANFCRQRLCPLCQWRRSRRLYGQLSDLWGALKDDGFEFVHLVLTCRNCSDAELDNTITRLFRGFTQMVHFDEFAGFKGFLRFFEVTYSPASGEYHPHLHVLGVVRASYFKSRYYISQKKLADLWRLALRADYTPIVHIGKADSAAINEVAKYCVKPFDFIGLDFREEVKVYEVLDVALHGRRTIQSYGCVRQMLRALKIDLEQDEGLPDRDLSGGLTFLYNRFTRSYENS